MEAERRQQLIEQGKGLKDRLTDMESRLQTAKDRLQVPALILACYLTGRLGIGATHCIAKRHCEASEKRRGTPTGKSCQ